ncbi:MAG: hypothetical protein UZ15_CFX003000076 [Chloroflexi bacterium OLB15]|nr:MAG: hypothetical protein UZ15_CFX003000076 [Chloroflexi bacterium OLB15]
MSSIQPASAWNVVYVAASLPEAHIISGRLQSEGIPSWIAHEPIASAYGLTSGTLGDVRVLVIPADYDRAMEILESEPDDLEDDMLLDEPEDTDEFDDQA